MRSGSRLAGEFSCSDMHAPPPHRMPLHGPEDEAFDQQAETMISNQLAMPIPDANREHFERHCRSIRKDL